MLVMDDNGRFAGNGILRGCAGACGRTKAWMSSQTQGSRGVPEPPSPVRCSHRSQA